MAIQKIIYHPSACLRKKVAEEGAITDRLRQRAKDMLETMYAASGIGLAAPQIGKSERLIVLDCALKDEEPAPLEMVNPRIVVASEEYKEFQEGCLSIPGHMEFVKRPASVRVSWLDLEGNPQEKDFDGLWGICIQHEIDHLNGRLFIDYLSALKRHVITRKMKKFKREQAAK